MRFYTCAVKLGILKKLDEAISNEAVRKIMAKHSLTTEEVEQWRKHHDRNGLHGLKLKDLVNRN